MFCDRRSSFPWVPLSSCNVFCLHSPLNRYQNWSDSYLGPKNFEREEQLKYCMRHHSWYDHQHWKVKAVFLLIAQGGYHENLEAFLLLFGRPPERVRLIWLEFIDIKIVRVQKFFKVGHLVEKDCQFLDSLHASTIFFEGRSALSFER